MGIQLELPLVLLSFDGVKNARNWSSHFSPVNSISLVSLLWRRETSISFVRGEVGVTGGLIEGLLVGLGFKT